MKSIVVIPTYNEIDNIYQIIDAIKNTAPEMHILIVDDNSPDGTAEAVLEMRKKDNTINLLRRTGKLGLGTAYCDGFSYCLSQGFDVICEMDADFSHDPKVLPVFLEEIKTHDLVIGSRYSTGVNVVNWPLHRLILSYGANLYSKIVTGMPIHDATGGFKCFRAEALRKVDFATVHSNGYGFQIEMNFRLWKAGARIKEVSIIFIDRRSGVSKMSKNIIFESVKLVWKLRFFFWLMQKPQKKFALRQLQNKINEG